MSIVRGDSCNAVVDDDNGFSGENSLNKPEGATTATKSSVASDQYMCSSKDCKKFLYVYTDIIESRRIGSKTARCLKVFAADANVHGTKRFSNIEYVNVSSSYIPSISIKLADQTGAIIKFNNSIVPTMVILHFKKV